MAFSSSANGFLPVPGWDTSPFLPLLSSLPPAFIAYIYLAVNSSGEQCSDRCWLKGRYSGSWMLMRPSRLWTEDFSPVWIQGWKGRAALPPATLGFISTLNFPVVLCSQYHIRCVAQYARAGNRVSLCHSSRKRLAQGSGSCMKCNGLRQRRWLEKDYSSISSAFNLWFDK